MAFTTGCSRRRVVATVVAAAIVATTCTALASPSAAATTTPVMRSSRVTAADLAGWFRTKGKTSKATVSIDTLASYFISEGSAEGVAGDLAFAQSIVETGYFNFSTRAPASFNNFSGLGAVDGGTSAAKFKDARTGVRAQIQHLRAYADRNVTVAKLANPLVDPRFHLVSPKGKAPNWEQFGNGVWASASGYAELILRIYGEILAYAGNPPAPNPPTVRSYPPFASARALVAQGHRDLLAREPSASELNAGAARLDGGGTGPAQYLAGLVDGEGADHAQPVVRLYLAGLGRLPDRGGLQYWTRRHAAGVRLPTLATQFLTSSEFERRYGRPSDAGYVELLYVNVLGRAADQAGADYWSRRLSAKALTRTQLLVQFSQSAEHVRSSQSKVEASVVYLGMVLRPPDPSVLSWWATKRAAGSGVEVLTDLVFTSSAYRARFT